MPIKINGQTTGSVTLAAPATGSEVILTLPTTALATLASPTFTGNVVLPDTTTMGSGTTLGSWTSFSPSLSAASGTFTSASIPLARYTQIGKTVHCRYTISITTNGTAASYIIVSLPIAKSGLGSANGSGREMSVTGKMLQIVDASSTTLAIFNYDNTYPGGNGYNLSVTITYEAA